MQDTEKDTKITPLSFRERFEVIKPLLKGDYFEVAKRAGCNPSRVVNAIYGKIVSPDLLQPIMDAMEEVAREELKKIQL